jgi:hypothetical protein
MGQADMAVRFRQTRGNRYALHIILHTCIPNTAWDCNWVIWPAWVHPAAAAAQLPAACIAHYCACLAQPAPAHLTAANGWVCCQPLQVLLQPCAPLLHKRVTHALPLNCILLRPRGHKVATEVGLQQQRRAERHSGSRSVPRAAAVLPALCDHPHVANFLLL